MIKLESEIQAEIIKWAEESGYIALKAISNNKSGFPDLTLVGYNSRLVWVEVKRPGNKPRQLQQWRHEQLKERGHTVAIVESLEEFISYHQSL